jgi:hypothetical protein
MTSSAIPCAIRIFLPYVFELAAFAYPFCSRFEYGLSKYGRRILNFDNGFDVFFLSRKPKNLFITSCFL